jgi:pantoate--beta-alanine ligase
MTPEQIDTIEGVRRRLAQVRQRGCVIGFVPTMGALHAGHGALIERARRESHYVVVSIFVNPIQFDRHNDYEAYTIDLRQDLESCGALGADLVFTPTREEMYPAEPAIFVEVAGLADHLCGRFRPGHFRGVATVVAKLLHIVAPDRAYFGEKDAQQLAIIQRMVVDLNLAVEIVPVPTARESDGLALSSRNKHLSGDERQIAPILFQALLVAQKRVAAGCTAAADAKETALQLLKGHPQMRVEYLEVVDAASLAPVERIGGAVRIAAAVWVGGTRLIDNVSVPE